MAGQGKGCFEMTIETAVTLITAVSHTALTYLVLTPSQLITTVQLNTLSSRRHYHTLHVNKTDAHLLLPNCGCFLFLMGHAIRVILA